MRNLDFPEGCYTGSSALPLVDSEALRKRQHTNHTLPLDDTRLPSQHGFITWHLVRTISLLAFLCALLLLLRCDKTSGFGILTALGRLAFGVMIISPMLIRVALFGS